MSHLGDYLTGTQGRGLGRWACVSKASWEDSDLDHPVSYLDNKLVREAGKKAQGHLLEGTGYQRLYICSLGLQAKAKQTHGAVRSHPEPCRQQDGAQKGSLGVGSGGGRGWGEEPGFR